MWKNIKIGMRYLQKHYGCNEGNICQFCSSLLFASFHKLREIPTALYIAEYGCVLNSVNGSSG